MKLQSCESICWMLVLCNKLRWIWRVLLWVHQMSQPQFEFSMVFFQVCIIASVDCITSVGKVIQVMVTDNKACCGICIRSKIVIQTQVLGQFWVSEWSEVGEVMDEMAVWAILWGIIFVLSAVSCKWLRFIVTEDSEGKPKWNNNDTLDDYDVDDCNRRI